MKLPKLFVWFSLAFALIAASISPAAASTSSSAAVEPITVPGATIGDPDSGCGAAWDEISILGPYGLLWIDGFRVDVSDCVGPIDAQP